MEEDKFLLEQLIAILSKHCGETGENEGALETLQRISEIINRLKERIKIIQAEYDGDNPNQSLNYYGLRANKLEELKNILGNTKLSFRSGRMKIAFNPQLIGVYYYQAKNNGNNVWKCIKCSFFEECEECVKQHYERIHKKVEVEP